MKTAVTDPPNARPATSAARTPTTPTSPSGEVPKAPPANDNAEVVEATLETGERTLAVGAWRFTVADAAANDTEPRVRDIDAAERLGFKEPRMIRKLIKRIWPSGDGPINRSTVSRWIAGKGAERERVVDEFWLTEAQLLKVVARSETPIAEAILDDMIRVYLAVRRFLLAHPHARPVPPELLDRPAIRVDTRIAAHPATPIAEDSAPRVTSRLAGMGANEREEFEALGWTFTRFHADPRRAPRVTIATAAARLGVPAWRIARAAEAGRRTLASLAFPGDGGETWLPCEALRAMLPRLATLPGVHEDALATLSEALDLVDAHVAERSVYVRAHYRHRPGALRASLAVAPFTVQGVRFHVIRRDGFFVGVADEDLRAFLASEGVPIEGWCRARALLSLRGNLRTHGMWTDTHGEFFGLAAAEHFLDALLPESLSETRFNAHLDAVEALYEAAECRAAELLDTAQGANTLAAAFVPRRLDTTVRALPV